MLELNDMPHSEVTEADYDAVLNVNLKVFCHPGNGTALDGNQADWKNHQHQFGA